MEGIFLDNCSECGQAYTGIEDVCEKLNEIVDWINKHEKDNRQTMQEAIQLMIEDMKNATKAKTTNPTGTTT